MQNNQITICQPDDWHLHLRDCSSLVHTVNDSSRYFARAIIMPNLTPPITEVKQAEQYRQRIFEAIPEQRRFQPLMTLYLTDNTTAEDIRQAKESGFIHAVKLYPAGATTNSAAGVSDISNCSDALAEMEKLAMPLLLHGEVTDANIDIFDREKVFIDRVLAPLRQQFPALKMVFEHITTADAVAYVTQAGPLLAATITPHHLLLNRNDLLVGGIKPHHYCLPVLKRNMHQQALIEAASSGSNKFFLGTDSAPHPQSAKESACGCAGIYSAHAAIELYAEAFEQANALDKLEGFASFYGPDFYGLARNKQSITLQKSTWQVPAQLKYADNESLIPLRAGENLSWQVIT